MLDKLRKTLGICRHEWRSIVAFVPGEKNRQVIHECNKCQKRKVVFTGTRREYEKFKAKQK